MCILFVWQVPVVVQMVRSEYMVVSLPKHGHAIG
jgi:hypothetical protein